MIPKKGFAVKFICIISNNLVIPDSGFLTYPQLLLTVVGYVLDLRHNAITNIQHRLSA